MEIQAKEKIVDTKGIKTKISYVGSLVTKLVSTNVCWTLGAINPPPHDTGGLNQSIKYISGIIHRIKHTYKLLFDHNLFVVFQGQT